MPPKDEEIEELLEHLKRKRSELSGDTNRILTEQRQLDQSAMGYLDEDVGAPAPVQRAVEPVVTCVCGKAVPARFRHCPHCGKELAEP